MASPILDGYLINAKVPARGVWDELVFSFRPLEQDPTAEAVDTKRTGANRTAAMRKLLLTQVKAWNLKKPNADDTVPVTEEWLKRLPLSYLEAMEAAVQGYSTLEQWIDEKN